MDDSSVLIKVPIFVRRWETRKRFFYNQDNIVLNFQMLGGKNKTFEGSISNGALYCMVEKADNIKFEDMSQYRFVVNSVDGNKIFLRQII